MKKEPYEEMVNGGQAWINATTESLRPSECLCENCDIAWKCGILEDLNDKTDGLGVYFMITICPCWINKKEKEE